MKCGIIGLPNVGKSTLFNCLTSLKAPAQNYPFCTVDPNIGQVMVPDERLNNLAHVFQTEKVIPANMEFVDIAGLIPGAHKGEGLGNRFLSHIREAHSLLHLVRLFEDKNITHTQDTVDPLRDIQLIETELILADLESLQKRSEKLIKLSKGSTEKALQEELALVKQLIHFLSHKAQPARTFLPEKDKAFYFQNLNLLTAKPTLYVCNMDESGLKHSLKKLKLIQELYGEHSVLPISASLEEQLADMESETEKKEFLSLLGWKEPGLNRVIKSAYKKLNLITFFTAGKKEVRAWPIPQGSTAETAGGKIHSDFQRGFICAQVYPVEALKTFSSEKALKSAGLYRREGKTYIVQDGDVITFHFSVTKR